MISFKNLPSHNPLLESLSLCLLWLARYFPGSTQRCLMIMQRTSRWGAGHRDSSQDHVSNFTAYSWVSPFSFQGIRFLMYKWEKLRLGQRFLGLGWKRSLNDSVCCPKSLTLLSNPIQHKQFYCYSFLTEFTKNLKWRMIPVLKFQNHWTGKSRTLTAYGVAAVHISSLILIFIVIKNITWNLHFNSLLGVRYSIVNYVHSAV